MIAVLPSSVSWSHDEPGGGVVYSFNGYTTIPL